MKKPILLIALLFLSGCVEDESVKPTFNEEFVVISWDRTIETDDKCSKIVGDVGINKKIGGCASSARMQIETVIKRLSNAAEKQQYVRWCRITAPPVKYVDDEETLVLGHEVNHCFTGSYHD